MQVAILVSVLLFVFVGARIADSLHRILSPDLVAVAFSDGGDDAYYYFTVARNIGHGAGATVDGEHWTTGFQPLWQLITGAAFMGSDRVALAIIYVLSFACWLVGLALFVRFIARASTTPLTPLTTALLAVLFLCDTQLNLNYLNGLETGLYLTLCLGLLLVFQAHIASAPALAKPARLVGIGVLAAITMLTRNDAVFLSAGLLAVTFLPGARPRPFREALVIVATASVLIVPWLVYCQILWGYPMPQTGVATSASILGANPWSHTLRTSAIALVPTYFLKVRATLDDLPVAVLLATCLAVAVILGYWRLRDHKAAIDRSSRTVLIGLAAAAVMMFLYYAFVSNAGQFFARYFTPIKLLVLILLALFAIRGIDRLRSQWPAKAVITALAIAAVGSNLYWIWRDFYLPYRSYMGQEAYDIARLPYGQGSARIGTPESGRLGFLYPNRVVNMDGKMRIDALRAMQTRTLDKFIARADLDYIFLTDFYVEFFDKMSPAWRDNFKRVDRMGVFNVFANTSKAR